VITGNGRINSSFEGGSATEAGPIQTATADNASIVHADAIPP
jgi:hypothetical protein